MQLPDVRLPINGGSIAVPKALALDLGTRRLVRQALPWLPMLILVGLSFTLNAWSLSLAGYGNTYYAAAVRSMTMSWSNFFFGAFDPGGFITVDKPPVFLWVGALSARTFGYSTWSILLPSAIAGAASVGLLWLIVRRYFGVSAATVAGLVLALSPISVAVNRLNLPESFMILALIGAAGATLQSIDSRRWWAWIALAGFLVGVAFNTKMLAAWIPGPALAFTLIVATRTISWTAARELFARLALLAVVTFIVSGSWMVAVDLWPADARPYIGGSTDNTVFDLAIHYNGLGRVEGTDQIGGGGGSTRLRNFPNGRPQFFARPNGANGAPASAPPVAPGGAAPTQPRTGGFAGPGGIFGGLPGALRMFDDANGGQIGWLLPFAVGGGILALWHWRGDPARRAFAMLFLLWIGMYGGVFSYAHGIFHSYYTSAMAPGVAALVGIAYAAASDAINRDRRWLVAVGTIVGVTLWTQLQIAGRTPDFYGWVRPFTIGLSVTGIALIVVLTARRMSVVSGVALAIGGLLLLPAAWSASAASNASLNATLPQAGQQVGASGNTFGSLAFNDGTADLAEWLKKNANADAKWQLVVPNSQNGSRLIAQYRLSVMSLGGFLGRDNTISVPEFADFVESGDVRYVLTGMGPNSIGRGFLRGPFGGSRRLGGNATAASSVISAVEQVCVKEADPSLPTAYQDSLYNCAGTASRLRQLSEGSAP